MKSLLRACYSRGIRSLNPATGVEYQSYAPASSAALSAQLGQLDAAYGQFSQMRLDNRLEYLSRVSDNVARRKSECAQMMTREVGKTNKQAVAEIDKCLGLMKFYVDNSAKILQEKKHPFGLVGSTVVYESLGIVFQLAPFNFPFWQVIRFATPTIAVGNVVLMRHSHNCPATALLLQDLFTVKGFPTALQNVFASHEGCNQIINDDRVLGVTITGGAPAGRKIAAVCGGALKKCVLELGGNDAAVICSDANVDLAVEKTINSRILGNCGQSCNSIKRCIVHKDRKEEFESKLVAAMKKIVYGDPTNPKTDIGPLARHDLRDEVHGLVTAGVKGGAKVLLGGFVPETPELKKGAFYPPTVVSNVSTNNTLFWEEVFGPVVSVISCSSDKEGLDLANKSKFGLSGCVFTNDLVKGEKMARSIRAGMGFLNDQCASHWALPFGGFPGKESGYGRECGEFGMFEFVNVKGLRLNDKNGKPLP